MFNLPSRWLLVTTLSWCLLLASPLRAQQAGSVDPSFGASLGLTANVVQTLVQPDGRVLVAGTFARSLVRLNTDGSLDPSFDVGAGPDQQIEAMVLQPDGKIVILGDFNTVNGTTHHSAARLNPDGSVDPTFVSGTGVTNAGVTFIGYKDGLALPTFANAALQADGKIDVCGSFTAVNGISRTGIARFNADGTLDTGFGPGANADGQIIALLPQTDGKVIVVGQFSTFQGTSAGSLIRLNTDGSIDPSFVSGVVGNQFVMTATLQGDGKLIVAGLLTNIKLKGVPFGANVLRLNADGSLDTSFQAGVGASGSVPIVTSRLAGGSRRHPAGLTYEGTSITTVAVQASGKVVAFGDFTSFDGVARSGYVRLNADGTPDLSFDVGTGFDGRVTSVVPIAGGNLLIGGAFGTVNGVGRNGVAQLDKNGGVVSGFQADAAPGLNGYVNDVFPQADGKIIAVGSFTAYNGVPHERIVRLDAEGDLDTTFAAGSGGDDTIDAVVPLPNGQFLVGGSFLTFDGMERAGVVRLNADGSLDASFDPGTAFDGGSAAPLILQADGKILAGGSPTNSAGITRLNADGSTDSTFNPIPVDGSYSNAVALQPDGKILLSGDFATYGGATHQHLVRLNGDGSVDPGYVAGVDDAGDSAGYDAEIDKIVIQPDGKVLIAGYFTSVNGTAGYHGFARLNSDGSLDAGFNPGAIAGADGVYTLAVQPDGKILTSIFSLSDSQHGGVARYNADGTLDATFVAGLRLDAAAGASAVQADGKIVIGGGFHAVDGVLRNYLARLNGDGSLDTSFAPGQGLNGVNALVLQPDDGKVLAGGSFSGVDGVAVNALARLNPDGTLDAAFLPGFADGDSVQALALQPDDGNVLVASLDVDSPSGAVAAAVGRHPPNAQTKVQNHIHRCSKTNGAFDTSFAATTEGTTFALAGLHGRFVLIGGSFGQVNAVNHAGLARLNSDGSLDGSFVGTADANVRALAVQGDGRIVIGGDFANVDGVARSHVARLNADGSLDPSFVPGLGPDGSINALKVLANGQILIGGGFDSVDGVSLGGLARLNADGSLDPGFVPGPAAVASMVAPTTTRRRLAVAGNATGSSALITSLDVQDADGKVVVGGSFDTLGATRRHNVARLNTDGSVDTTFDPGSGPDAPVNALRLQPDGRTLLGGAFVSVDGLERPGAARLFGDPNFVSVSAKVSSITAPPAKAAKFIVTRMGGTLVSPLTVNYTAVGSAKAGVDYLPLAGSVVIPAGQTSAVIKAKLLDIGPDIPAKRVIKLKLQAADGYLLSPTATQAKALLLAP